MGPDPDAVEDLLAQDAQLRALARRLVTDPDVADDVTQDAWLVAASRKARGAPPPFGWLARVVRNLSLHVGRGEVRRTRRERAAARDETLPPTDEAIQRVEMRRRLIEAVLGLEEPFRTTTILRFFENEPPRRIAARLGIPVETVRSRLKRALALLRAKLDRDFGHDRRASFALLASLAGLHVPAATAAGAATAATTVAIGGLLMKTKWALACVVVALLAGSLLVLWPRDHDSLERGTSSREPVTSTVPGFDEDKSHAERSVAANRGVSIVPKTVFEAGEDSPSPFTSAFAVRVIWQADRTPAADARVRLFPWGDPDGRDAMMLGMTNASGSCRFDRVPQGNVGLFISPSGFLQTACTPGIALQEVTVEIPEGNPIEGRVLNTAGVPVGGAEIWLSDDVTAWDGSVVTRSGADGRFTIRGVQRGDERNVGARAQGYAASVLQRVPWRLVEVQPIELALRDEPATLRGRVLDAGGSPLSGASVMLGAPGWEAPNRQEDKRPKSPTFRASTDARGGFQFDGLAPGEWSLITRARHLPLCRAGSMLAAGEVREVELRIANGATVVGELVDEAGAPIPKVGVRQEPRESWLSRSVFTGADGRFRLEGIAPGRIELFAGGLSDGGGTATATIEAREGETASVRIVMAAGATIRGRVIDEGGAPIPAATIRVSAEIGGGAYDSRQATAAEDGSFTIHQCRQTEYQLWVEEPGAGSASLRMEGVRPGPQELVLKIPKESRPTAFVLGSIVDAEGVPIRDALACPFGAHGGPNTPTKADGSFRAGPLAVGTYRLTVSIRPASINDPVFWVHEGSNFTLGVGESRDLGVIRVLNRLRVDMTRNDRKPVEGVNSVVWLRLTGAALKLRLHDGVATSAPLPAGTHRLEIRGDGINPVERSFEVRYGEETRLDITLEAAKGR